MIAGNEKFGDLKLDHFGVGYCEVAHLPEINVLKIPENVSYEEAAAASMTLLTSWHMLVGRAKIKPGQTVLVMGGSSGVGIFGIQIAKLYGCVVIATASPDKLERLKELGADYAIDHRKEDWHKEVRGITKEIAKRDGVSPGVDVVFEAHWWLPLEQGTDTAEIWCNNRNHRGHNWI